MAQIVQHFLSRGAEGEFQDGLSFIDVYTVIADAPLATPVPIWTHPKTPKRGEQHDRYPAFRVQGVRPQSDDQQSWDVEVRWSAELDDPGAANPIDRPPSLTMQSSRQKVQSSIDGEGRLLLNTAGDRLPPVEKRLPTKSFRITKNISVGFPPVLEDFDDAVNDDRVTLMGRRRQPETLLVATLAIGDVEREHDPESGETFEYRVLELDLDWNPRGWHDPLVNEGFNELVETEDADGQTVTEKRKILLDDGEEPAEPLLLNKQGRPFREQSSDESESSGEGRRTGTPPGFNPDGTYEERDREDGQGRLLEPAGEVAFSDILYIKNLQHKKLRFRPLLRELGF